MRILHVSKYYYPYIGGVENICRYLVENMPQHQSAVVCFNEERKNSVDEVNGHKVWRVSSTINVARQAISLSYFNILRKAIREFEPDVVQLHWANPFAGIVLLSVLPKDVKLVIHWHMDIVKQKKIYPLIKPIETALLQRADLVCVTSPAYAEHSRPLQPFRSKIRVVPNSFNEEGFKLHPGDQEEILKIKENYGGKPIVFFVGRHIQYKGLPSLIEASKYVKNDCEFVIAGKGPLTNQLKAQAGDTNVRFIGPISNDSLRQHLYAASIFAFPSITKNEAFGIALAEAMYTETPAITFTIPGSGVNWVSINDKTCLEVENSNPKAYAAAIDRLLQDEALRQRLAQAGHDRVVENFTIPKMCARMQSVYEELK